MTAKARVLLLITELNVGGAERIVEQLATRLSRDRYALQVACLYDPHPVGVDIRAAGISVVDLEMRNKADLRAPLRLLRLLRHQEIQILHAHLFHANLLGATVGKLAGVPAIIATRHNVNIGGSHREQVYRWSSRLCDAVVAISAEVQRVQLQRSRTPSSRVTLIPNGVQVDTFVDADQRAVDALADEWHIAPHTPVIGTLARLHEQKGHVYLLDAVARLRRELPTIKVLVVGDGALRRPLEAQSQDLGLSDAVIFTGTRREVPEILALLDVFVLPSLWEGLPIALLEAMAAGLPVVATPVGGVPEVVVDGATGLLVPPRDPEALANAILALLRQPDLRCRMGSAGQARVRERFSIERMIRDTDALYQRLLAKKGLL